MLLTMPKLLSSYVGSVFIARRIMCPMMFSPPWFYVFFLSLLQDDLDLLLFRLLFILV
jgi:hypothetical protein